jgi:hypothetical protein
LILVAAGTHLRLLEGSKEQWGKDYEGKDMGWGEREKKRGQGRRRRT